MRAGPWIAGLAALWSHAASAQQITGVSYVDPTMRYAHGVLGDAVEWGALRLGLSDNAQIKITLPKTLVFEDIAPRLADLDGDGAPEVIVVESSLDRGARLAVYGAKGRIAATPHIGQRNRWLAPVGAADLDGDGRIEIAYIDRPHLAKTLRIWRYVDGMLQHVVDHPGLTNHKIGWNFVPGGLRDCGDGPEMILSSADWSSVVAVRMMSGQITTRNLAPYQGPDSLTSVTNCP